MDFYMLNNLGTNNEQKPPKQLNKKKLVKIIIAIIIILLIIAMVILYFKNIRFRNFFDIYIFRKEVYENNLDTISLNEEDNNYSYAFDKNIAVLCKNELSIYNSSAKKEHSLNVEITNPIFCANNKFLGIAENKGQKIYLISENNILWQKNMEGDIINITVNKNGYVSVIVINTSYKSEVTVFDSNGNKLMTYYLATSYAIDSSISEDNKYLAIAEANFSGTLIQSNIEIILMESKTQEYNYEAESNELIINIEYQEKDKLVCMYDDSIHIIQNNSDTEFMKYDSKNILFLDINLNSNIAQIEKISSGLFNSNSSIKFTSTINNSSNTYELGGIPKTICSYKDVTAVNLGVEAIFVKTNGWLSKRYKSNQEIQNIILTNSIAGIVYKNKIEIVKL